MNNKRKLKHTISLVCSELFADGIAIAHYHGKTDKENTEALLASIIVIHSDYIKRVSHPEPGIRPKDYFDKLIADFNKQVEEIADQLNNLV